MRSYERRKAELHDGSPVVSAVPLLCVALALTLASGGALGLVSDLGAASFPSW